MLRQWKISPRENYFVNLIKFGQNFENLFPRVLLEFHISVRSSSRETYVSLMEEKRIYNIKCFVVPLECVRIKQFSFHFRTSREIYVSNCITMRIFILFVMFIAIIPKDGDHVRDDAQRISNNQPWVRDNPIGASSTKWKIWNRNVGTRWNVMMYRCIAMCERVNVVRRFT